MTQSSASSRPLGSALRWLGQDFRATLCLGYLLLLVAFSLLAPLITPHSPIEQTMDFLTPPDATHWLGTDDLGRDVFARLVYGTPMSLYASCLAVAVGLSIGLPLGMLAGYLGGWFDSVVSRMIDTLLSFPGIVLAVAVTGALGIGLTNAMIAVGIVFAPNIARLIRIQTIVVKNELYVDASRSFGMSVPRIILRHIVPNAIQPVIVQVTLMLAGALLAEASLSFLGLGVQPPWPSWGQMLARGYTYMEIAPEQMYVPGIAILLTALAYNGLGESLRSRLDPTRRAR
ncbi:MAG TPA: ABC transporter permease [Sphingobium sp.]|jgi:peptide/nickel transport system permease protein|nr:ABC transporter permease [Sphingobium sp.]